MNSGIISKSWKAVKAIATGKVSTECDRIPYEFDHLPFKKILNWIRVESSLLKKPEKPWGWPTHVQIEPTSFCNLRCALCPVTEGMHRAPGHMDLDLFKRLVDEIGEYVFLLLLWDWGEPFLNPSIYEMIATAKMKGIKVISSTNGHLFKDVRQADKVIQSGLDTLIVAMDGISQETYQKYRQGGRLEDVLKGIETLVMRKRVLHSEIPFLNLRFIVMRHNEHEVPLLEKFARALGVDALTLKTLNPCANDTYSVKKDIQGSDKFSPSDFSYRRFEYGADGKQIRLANNPCRNLWNSTTIHWDGTVCPCTYDYDEKFTFGNLKEKSFKDIWFDLSYRRMRRQFRANLKELIFCRECSYAFKGGNCIDETIADAIFFNKEKTA